MTLTFVWQKILKTIT